jgi:hypothetical protein
VGAVASKKVAEQGAKAVEPEVKIANLLALVLVKGIGPGDAIVTLTRAGFSVQEICGLLNTTPGNVSQTNYAARRNKPKTGKKKNE